MTEKKKELNIDELENVSGGFQEVPDDMVGKHVEVKYILLHIFHKTLGGEITNCAHTIYGNGAYYIVFEDAVFNGWYKPEVLHKEHESIEAIYKDKLTEWEIV